MQKRIFHPRACRDCLVSERIGLVYQCKFYGQTYMPVQGEKPPYCRAKIITVEEDKIDNKPPFRQQNANKNNLH